MRLFPALLLAACFSLPVMADSLEAEPASAEAIQATPGQQPGIYRFGATYEFTNTANVDDCQQLCNTRSACLAWSYIAALRAVSLNAAQVRSSAIRSRPPVCLPGTKIAISLCLKFRKNYRVDRTSPPRQATSRSR